MSLKLANLHFKKVVSFQKDKTTVIDGKEEKIHELVCRLKQSECNGLCDLERTQKYHELRDDKDQLIDSVLIRGYSFRIDETDKDSPWLATIIIKKEVK